MSPGTQIFLSGVLTFGVPLALAARELLVLRRRRGGFWGPDDPPTRVPLSPLGWQPSLPPLRPCLDPGLNPHPSIELADRTRRLESV